MNIPITVSSHASIRVQQRGISRPLVEFILAKGEYSHQRGARVFFVPKRNRLKVPPNFRDQLARRPCVIAQCAENYIRIITVCWLYKRPKHNWRPSKVRHQGRER